MDSKKGGIVALVLVVLLSMGAWVGMDLLRPVSDQKQIEIALKAAIKGSKDGSPGNALELLSRNLVVNDQEGSSDRKFIADFIRRQHPDIVVQSLQAQIIGTEGRIVSPVELDLGVPFGKKTLKEVTLIFRQEDGTKYVVIPVRKWRLVEIRIPQETWVDLGI